MNIKMLLETYGYVRMSLLEYDGLYYFRGSTRFNLITIAVEFLPEFYQDVPETLLPLIDFENTIPGNIVGVTVDDTLNIYNQAYQIHLESKFDGIWETNIYTGDK